MRLVLTTLALAVLLLMLAASGPAYIGCPNPSPTPGCYY
jgi:hypothetical protein